MGYSRWSSILACSKLEDTLDIVLLILGKGLAMVPCLEPISKRIKNQKLHTLYTINYVVWESDLAQWKDLILTAITLMRSPVQLPQAAFFFSEIYSL